MEGANDLACLFEVIIEFSCSGQCAIDEYFCQAINLGGRLIRPHQVIAYGI
jgi:hypothetical protein